MKLVNYTLQTQMENLSELKSQSYFIDYINTILEDDSKPYYSKADYIGLSLNELKNKIDYLSSNISELQAYKKKLSQALNIAKEITAKALINNGINRIDGNIISSLTLSKPTQKTKNTIAILDEQAVMKLGYVKFEPDIKAIEEAIQTSQGKKELDKFVSVISTTTTIPAKIKVNTKRTVNNVTITTNELLEQKQVA